MYKNEFTAFYDSNKETKRLHEYKFQLWEWGEEGSRLDSVFSFTISLLVRVGKFVDSTTDVKRLSFELSWVFFVWIEREEVRARRNDDDGRVKCVLNIITPRLLCCAVIGRCFPLPFCLLFVFVPFSFLLDFREGFWVCDKLREEREPLNRRPAWSVYMKIFSVFLRTLQSLLSYRATLKDFQIVKK